MKRVIRSVMIVTTVVVVAVVTCSQTVNLQLQNNYTLGSAQGTPRFAVGDLNGDGRPDLVATVGLVNQPVSIFLNDGNGGFAAPVSVAAAFNASAAAIGDFNNDGKADLALGSVTNSAGINIRLGDGSGSFPTGTDTAVAETVTDIVTADFNGDGNLDLAVTKNGGYASQPTNAVHLMLGNGSGGFGSPTIFGIGNAPLDLEVADLNGDGRPDIAASSFTTTNTISILMNNGSGGFTAAPSISWANASANGRLVAGDFNRDCATDLVVVRSDSVAVLIGNNTGSFTVNSVAVSAPVPASVAVGDFNLDRRVDLGVGRLGSFSVLPGDGAGGFGAAVGPSVTSITDNMAVMDINVDGKADIALSTRNNSFSVYNGSSAFAAKTENDFDGDMKADLAVYRPSTGTWYENRSTKGFFGQQWGVSSDKPVPADYDGDGKTDIAVWREDNTADPQHNSYFFVFQSSTSTLKLERFGSIGDLPTTVGDWDGDGRADVAVYRNGAAAGAQSLFYYRPSSAPGTVLRVIPWGTAGDQPIRGDFDGDGKLDATVYRSSDNAWYIQQSSNGQLVYQKWGVASDKRVVADYDGDGRSDIAIFRPAESVWYILQSSNGTAISRQWGTSTDVLVPADYNADGRAEVAVYRPGDQRWYIPPCATVPASNTRFGINSDLAATAVP